MSYLARGDGQVDDKATLAQKDIRFARTVQRLQRSIISELEKICVIHLFTLGYRGNDLLSFKLALNNPSKLAELQELEHWKARFEAADGASAGYFSRRWVAKNILNISEEEFQRMQAEMFYDKKHDFFLEQVGETAAAEGGGLGGALGVGGPEEGAPEIPTPEAGPAETPPETPEETGPLLATPGAPPAAGAPDAAAPAPPANRDEYGRSYSENKGKRYYHANRDDRSSGARRRANAAQYGSQNVGRSKRSFLHGLSDLNGLTKLNYSLSESKDPNYYDDQEREIFQENVEIKKLIDGLESLEKKQNEDET